MRKVAMSLVAALAGLVLVAVTAHAQSKMTIKLSPKYLITGSTRQIEVVDQNCQVNLGTFSITGGGSAVPVSICKSDAGYGNISYRNLTNNGPWTNSSLLHDGEEVSP